MLPPLVADANIAFSVVRFLRSQGIDVVYSREQGWQHYQDKDILANAHSMNRFVLTHDSDFGRLAIDRNQPITGIIHLRPGARPSSEVISDLQELLEMEVDWTPPLIAVYRCRTFTDSQTLAKELQLTSFSWQSEITHIFI